jgi:hypothetical protein
MELYVMNKSLETIGIIDSFTSVIWTKRHLSCGDFELHLPVTAEAISLLQTGNYIYRTDDESVMIIEKIQIVTDSETGNYLTVSGRSLESILTRRIIWDMVTFVGYVEDFLRKIITQNAVNPTNNNRKITNLILANPIGLKDRFLKQVIGDNLYDVIVEVCTTYKIGWKITLNEDRQFVFSLYKGVDHSHGQSDNPYVVFSPKFDNLINSNYERDTSTYSNVALVSGETEEEKIQTQTVSVGTPSDLDRIEIYVDAGSLKSDDETSITVTEYAEMLSEKGLEALSEKIITTAFDGDVETTELYEFRRDWNLGDIVQIENEYGITATSQILEIIESVDASGKRVIPTFAEWEVN